MWKRDESVRTTSVESTAVPHTTAQATVESPLPRPEARHQPEKGIVHIGTSVVIKGELNGSEDLTIEGQIEGTIQLREHILTIGPNAQIKAQVFAKAVIVLGELTGNVTATDKVEIREHGSVDGDIVATRVAISEGAHFRGSVDMQGGKTAAVQPKGSQGKAKATAGAAQAQPVGAGA